MVRRVIYIVFAVLAITSLSVSGQVPGSRPVVDSLVSSRGQAVVYIKDPGPGVLDILTRNLSISVIKDGLVGIVLAPGDVDYFISLDIPFYIIPEENSKSVQSAATMADAMNWDIYPTAQQYDSIMLKFANDYPLLCRLDTIGTTYLGRKVLVLKISDNVDIDEPEPEVFFTSTMHGHELAGFVLMMRFAERLLTNYAPGSLEEMLIDSLEIWINPLANPDGTYTGFDLPGTRDTIYSPTRVNFNGTDLNRSFPGPITNELPDNETYNFINFQAERKFVLSMNIHSGYEVVNYPWDTWLAKSHPDDTWFETISRRYADTVHYYSGTGYLNYMDNGIVRGAAWYVIYGGRQDYITWAQQGREVTLEIDDTFQTPGAQLPLLWEYNYRSFLHWAENAIYGIHGYVKDQLSGDPVAAKIYIAGYDADSSHVYSDTLSGSFVRMLSPGTYDLVFTASGYFPELVNNVEVVDFEQTWINVVMEKDPQSVDLITESKMRIWPVPAKDEIYLLLPANFTGDAEITVVSLSGKLVLSVKESLYPPAPVRIPVRGLSPGVYICTVRTLNSTRAVSTPFIVR